MNPYEKKLINKIEEPNLISYLIAMVIMAATAFLIAATYLAVKGK